jgi:hypothetical protein
MASTYSNLKIELIGTGEQQGTWGTTTNTNLGTALEEAIVGRGTANFTTDADLTLTLTNSNATQVARNFVLNVTSGVSLTATRNLIVPTIEKPYIVQNNTTGSQSIVVKTTAGTGITVPSGKIGFLYTDATNVVTAFDYFDALTVGALTSTGDGTFSVARGKLNYPQERRHRGLDLPQKGCCDTTPTWIRLKVMWMASGAVLVAHKLVVQLSQTKTRQRLATQLPQVRMV